LSANSKNNYTEKMKNSISYANKETSPRDSSSIINQGCFLPKEFVPYKADVIIGRGKKCHKHAGNMRLKQIVLSRLDDYSSAIFQKEKSQILRTIINQIRSYNRGAFVKQDPKTMRWFKVGDDIAKEKISKAFRDALNRQCHSNKVCINKCIKQQVDTSVPFELKQLKNYQPTEKIERNQCDDISLSRVVSDLKFKDEIILKSNSVNANFPFDKEFEDTYSINTIEIENVTMNNSDKIQASKLGFDFGEFLDVSNEKTEDSNNLEEIDIEGLQQIGIQRLYPEQEIDDEKLEDININQIRIDYGEFGADLHQDFFSLNSSPFLAKGNPDISPFWKKFAYIKHAPTFAKSHQEYKRFFRSVTSEKMGSNRQKTLNARKA